MANQEYVEILRRGSEIWNAWRSSNPSVTYVNLCKADLKKAYLREANLEGADLEGADCEGADLRGARFSIPNASARAILPANLDHANFRLADLTFARLEWTTLRWARLGGADLRGAHLLGADLSFANLDRASLCLADLEKANLSYANLRKANVSLANLQRTLLVETELRGAKLNGCYIYGISAWNLELDNQTQQKDLVITPLRSRGLNTRMGPAEGETRITVDDLEMAQFMYLLLNNEKVRQVIDTVTSKVVLILGRFTKDRKVVLDAVRGELRRMNLTPVLFDFKNPERKDVTGTVEILARMARFVIADLTDPSSIPHELGTIVPFLRTTPVIPLRLAGSEGYSMFEDLRRAYTWVLRVHEYKDGPSLIADLPKLLAVADKTAKKLRRVP